MSICCFCNGAQNVVWFVNGKPRWEVCCLCNGEGATTIITKPIVMHKPKFKKETRKKIASVMQKCGWS